MFVIIRRGQTTATDDVLKWLSSPNSTFVFMAVTMVVCRILRGSDRNVFENVGRGPAEVERRGYTQFPTQHVFQPDLCVVTAPGKHQARLQPFLETMPLDFISIADASYHTHQFLEGPYARVPKELGCAFTASFLVSPLVSIID